MAWGHKVITFALLIGIIDVMEKKKGVIGRPTLGIAEKTEKVGFRLSKMVLSRYPSVRIKEIIMDLDEGRATLVYVDRPKVIETVNVVANEPVKKVNPIVAQLAASMKGVGTADKPIDRDSDRQDGETFTDFKSRALDYTPRPKVYSDRTQKAIDRLLRVYEGNKTINEGRNMIDDWLIKLNDDYDNAG